MGRRVANRFEEDLDMDKIASELVKVAKELVAMGELDSFLDEWRSGGWKFMSLYAGKTRPGTRPTKSLEVPRLDASAEEQARKVVVTPKVFKKTADYAYLTFIGGAGRTDTYVLTREPIEVVFPGTQMPRPKVHEIGEQVKAKLQERGLRSLGTRFGKAGEQFGDGDSARRISVGGRDLLWNYFIASVNSEWTLKRPDEGWRMHKAILLSQVTDADIDAAVKWVKAGGTMIQVRNNARENYRVEQSMAKQGIEIPSQMM